VRFLQPFAGVGYGMGVGIVLDPAHADFNGGGGPSLCGRVTSGAVLT
jgi:hypothetical protein